MAATVPGITCQPYYVPQQERLPFPKCLLLRWRKIFAHSLHSAQPTPRKFPFIFHRQTVSHAHAQTIMANGDRNTASHPWYCQSPLDARLLKINAVSMKKGKACGISKQASLLQLLTHSPPKYAAKQSVICKCPTSPPFRDSILSLRK